MGEHIIGNKSDKMMKNFIEVIKGFASFFSLTQFGKDVYHSPNNGVEIMPSKIRRAVIEKNKELRISMVLQAIRNNYRHNPYMWRVLDFERTPEVSELSANKGFREVFDALMEVKIPQRFLSNNFVEYFIAYANT